MTEKLPMRDVTDAERDMMKDLSSCTFQVASFDKRFVRNVGAQIKATGKVTERQGALIPTMHYRYRRQHGKPTPNYNPATDPKAHRKPIPATEQGDPAPEPPK